MAVPLRGVKFIMQRRIFDAISDIKEVTGDSEQARAIQFQVVMRDDVISVGFLVRDGGGNLVLKSVELRDGEDLAV